MKLQLSKFDVLESTNTTAVTAAKEGAPEGTVIVAERQTGGHGRLQREWSSPKGGLWFTIVLRPKIDPQFVAQVTLLAGVAVTKALRILYKTDAIAIKWPNDLLLNKKKVCGMLSEMELDDKENIKYAIIGIGVNVATETKSFPLELQQTATSLNESMQASLSCEEVLDAILREFTELYDEWQQNGSAAMLQQWRSLNCTLGSMVKVKDDDQVIFAGTALAIDDQGAIVVSNNQGETQSFNFGEISIR